MWVLFDGDLVFGEFGFSVCVCCLVCGFLFVGWFSVGICLDLICGILLLDCCWVFCF